MNFWKYTFSIKVIAINMVAKILTVVATIAAYWLGASALLLSVIFCSYWTLFAAFVVNSYYRWRKYLKWRKLNDSLPVMLISKRRRDGPA